MAADQALADLQEAITGVQALIEAIAPDHWHNPTPCDGVDVAELTGHLIAGNRHFAALITGAPAPGGDAPVSRDEAAAAFRQSAASLLSALAAPGVLDRDYRLPQGEVPGRNLIGIRLIEHLGHGWDLAQATGQQPPFSGDLAGRGLQIARAQLAGRPAGSQRPFGTQVPVPPDAPAMDRLAGFLGRGVRS